MRARMFVVAALAASACGTGAREARAIEPNPLDLLHSPDTLPVSHRLFIYQRDTGLPRGYQLRNWAEFAVVSRDRLRFHVGVVRIEESDADTAPWKVWLEDDKGRKIEPEARESPRINRVVANWVLWPYKPGDPWCPKPPCYSVQQPGYTVFEGRADYMFHEPNLARASKKLTLVLERQGVAYRYSWTFADELVFENYGRSKVDDELGIIALPGPQTQVAGTIYEDGR